MDLSQAAKQASKARGLTAAESSLVGDLAQLWSDRKPNNDRRTRYYLGHANPEDLGISVPPKFRNLRQAVDWPAIAVRALADRSVLDGFSSDDEATRDALRRAFTANDMRRAYRRAVISELVHGCAFCCVTDAGGGEPKVRFYPATAAAATWDMASDALGAGLVVVDQAKVAGTVSPVRLDLYTDGSVVALRYTGSGWSAERMEHGMGRPLMEALVHDATLERPLGRSRITRTVMDLTDDAIRASRRAEIAAEFATLPQKYLIGLSEAVDDGGADEEAPGSDGMTRGQLWDAAMGAMLTVGLNEEGDKPTFGQLAQPSMQPHTDYMRSLAARLAGETGVPLSCLGVYTDANPQSYEAMRATLEPLVIEARNLNDSNGRALRDVALMCLAVSHGSTYADEAADPRTLEAEFHDPSTPSVVSEADAWAKFVAAFPWMADSDVPLERLFRSEDVRRLRNDRKAARSAETVRAASLVPAAGATIADAAAALGAAEGAAL